MLTLKKGYWIIQAQAIKDTDSMEMYSNLWVTFADKFQAKIITATTSILAVEGGDASRVILVEFPSYEMAIDCYESIEYQNAKKYALQAMDRSLIVFEC